MLIAEDLLLLLTDDTSGKFAIDGSLLDLALVGACLRELADSGRVAVAGRGAPVKRGRLMVIDTSPTGDAILDDVLARCKKKAGRRPRDVVSGGGKKIRRRLLDRLVEHGVLERREGKVLGLFPTTRWPSVDHAQEGDVRTRLVDTLARGVTPDPRTVSLASLLSAVDAAGKLVDPADRRAAKRRASELRAEDWVADAVADAVSTTQAATAAVITTTS